MRHDIYSPPGHRAVSSSDLLHGSLGVFNIEKLVFFILPAFE